MRINITNFKTTNPALKLEDVIGNIQVSKVNEYLVNVQVNHYLHEVLDAQVYIKDYSTEAYLIELSAPLDDEEFLVKPEYFFDIVINIKDIPIANKRFNPSVVFEEERYETYIKFIDFDLWHSVGELITHEVVYN